MKKAKYIIAVALALFLTACDNNNDTATEVETEQEEVVSFIEDAVDIIDNVESDTNNDTAIENSETETEAAEADTNVFVWDDDSIFDMENSLGLSHTTLIGSIANSTDSALISCYVKDDYMNVVWFTTDGTAEILSNEEYYYDYCSKAGNINEFAAEYQEFPDNIFAEYSMMAVGYGAGINAWYLNEDGSIFDVAEKFNTDDNITLGYDEYCIGVRVNGESAGASAFYPAMWDPEKENFDIYGKTDIELAEIQEMDTNNIISSDAYDNFLSADRRSNGTIDILFDMGNYIDCYTYKLDRDLNIEKQVFEEDGYGMIWVLFQSDGNTELDF